MHNWLRGIDAPECSETKARWHHILLRTKDRNTNRLL